MRKTLILGLPELGITLTDGQIDTLCRYGEQMLEKNKVMNLTAIREPESVATLHFLDSLTLLTAADFSQKAVIDVGCGAGLPGVVLKIAEPSIRLTLLDSLGKRMAWLRETLPGLGVEADVVTARAEDYARDHREAFDFAVSRAVARLNVLAELCLPLVKVGGAFIAMKGAQADAEIAEAERAIRTLGGKVETVSAYEVGGAAHYAVLIRKTAPTPIAYPRTFAKIKQKPL